MQPSPVLHTQQPVVHSPLQLFFPLHERRQRERVAAVLHAENAQQEAVHEEDDGAPDDGCHLLDLFVCYSRDLDGQRNGREGKDTVYIYVR